MVSRIAWPSDATHPLDATMLAKCSNPSCSTRFLRLGNGRLFILETDPPRHSDKSERTEYFWLCEACSATTTLRIAEGERVVVVPLPEWIRDVSDANSLASRDPKKGLLLRSISLLSEHHEDRMSARWRAKRQAA